jgi:hypothetical protein
VPAGIIGTTPERKKEFVVLMTAYANAGNPGRSCSSTSVELERDGGTVGARIEDIRPGIRSDPSSTPVAGEFARGGENRRARHPPGAQLCEGITNAATAATGCYAAWNKLVDRPWRIMSIGLRQWAHGF